MQTTEQEVDVFRVVFYLVVIALLTRGVAELHAINRRLERMEQYDAGEHVTAEMNRLEQQVED